MENLKSLRTTCEKKWAIFKICTICDEAPFNFFFSFIELCNLCPSASRVSHALLLSRCSKWAYEDIREVHKRRYLFQVCFVCFTGHASDMSVSKPNSVQFLFLSHAFVALTMLLFCLFQETALEVFSSDGRNHFLVFPKPVRSKVYDK